MRKKTVTFDNADFVISPLNINQVDEFIKEMPPEPAGLANSHSLKVICLGLNNAKPEAPWTEERCRAEMDLPIMQFLFGEILKYSGLSAPVEAPVTA